MKRKIQNKIRCALMLALVGAMTSVAVAGPVKSFVASPPTKDGTVTVDVDGTEFKVPVKKGDTAEEKAKKIRDASVDAGVAAGGSGNTVTWKNVKCVSTTDSSGQKDPIGWTTDDITGAPIWLDHAMFSLPTASVATGLNSDGIVSEILFGLSSIPGSFAIELGEVIIPTAGVTGPEIIGEFKSLFDALGIANLVYVYDQEGVEFTAIMVSPAEGTACTAIWGTDDASLTYGTRFCSIPEVSVLAPIVMALGAASRRRR